MNNKKISFTGRLRLPNELVDRYNSSDNSFSTKYISLENQVKIKNDRIATFIRDYRLGNWYNGATGKHGWCHLSNIAIAKRLEGLLAFFLREFNECSDQKQLSKVFYFFEQCLVATLAKKYQVSRKKIYADKIIQKRGYILVKCENNNKYYSFFNRKKFLCNKKLMW